MNRTTTTSAARIGALGRRLLAAATIAAAATLLSGCLYPREQLAQNQLPAKDAVASVQAVVDLYQQETGLLPLKNASVETPAYEKFVVDFAKLQRSRYLSELPAATFEKGGSYYFLIQNEETDPTVKLMPLPVFQAVNDAQAEIDRLVRGGGAVPRGESVSPGFYRIDYAKLGVKEPKLRSVYSGGALALMLDERGKVYADYGSDLMRAAQKKGLDEIGPEVDLRSLLAEETDFVPVKSPVYRLIDQEPVPQPDES
ncbi:hypothetical protein HGI30_10050 [Paenibacillus albicereus]|uniref:DUF3939 domain-containing protein n=1 Tax=Paenibacillus albicereus TaxID=2726185 RepID=A0A6H2GXF9_9BACL|nr:hypothetical protein [Paenibacillus albicereus]QJC51856.1 hypothetical protein HGI30_10050 [Paenibacillus albicereus]